MTQSTNVSIRSCNSTAVRHDVDFEAAYIRKLYVCISQNEHKSIYIYLYIYICLNLSI